MATLTAQIKASISGITSDSIDIDTNMTKACLSGGITSRSINTNSAAGEKILEKDEYVLGDIVYLRNRDTSIVITIQLSAATAGEITLAGGAWCMFPWVKGEDILAYSASGAPVLEIGVFSGQ